MSRLTKKKRKSVLPGPNLTDTELRALNAWFQLIPFELQTKAFVLIGARALIDTRFRARLIANSREVLRELGVKIPVGMHLNFLENKSGSINIVLPPIQGIPAGKVVIRDEDLRAEFATNDDHMAIGGSDIKPGDWSRDPSVSNTLYPRFPSGVVDGTDPTIRDNFWADA
jgi:hypothetical protein